MTSLLTSPEASGHLAEKFVEINGVDDFVEVRDFNFSLIGEVVDANGKRGIARWDGDDEYVVDTTDGLVLCVGADYLRECEQASDHDLTWPVLPMAQVGVTFALRAVEKLRARAYCIIDIPADTAQGKLMKDSVGTRTDWTTPREEFKEAYLGKDDDSHVVWLNNAQPPDDLSSEPLSTLYGHMVQLSCGILPLTQDFLGFKASEHHAATLLRTAFSTAAEGDLVSQEDVNDGLVESHLDFIQRRRLCLVYFITSGGGLELFERGSVTPLAQVPACAGRLLVFRHDLLSYAYLAGTSMSVAIQTWILEEPAQLLIEGLEGSQHRLDRLFDGPKLATESQVHVMNANCRYPAGAYQLSRDWLVYAAQTDTFLEVPINRFDVTVYYDDGTGGQFNSTGKSSTKHCGFISDIELMQFDNEFFGIDGAVAQNIACIQRVLMEISYELLTTVGFTRQSLVGANIYCCIADIGLEWDHWQGYGNDREAWLRTGPLTNLSVNRLAHTFGIQGPCHQVDTACSASLVAANLCHAMLRKSEKGMKMSMSLGQQHILLPWPFIGLSQAGMLGSGGRCKTFDQSANGYNRGEGCGGLFCKAGDEPDLLQERLACYVSSYINQDGRSASLTAPNGPSQQAVARGSLSQGKISPEEVTCTENHGTGTALGDPIETGTIKSVFRKRDRLLPVTSGKSHMGHLECGAGSVGILKTICSLIHGGVPPNVHLRMPNAHCETEGFPGLFPVEVCDIPTEYTYGGCNGFGFGGTNTRADFWALRRNTVHHYAAPRRELPRSPLVWGESHPKQKIMPRLDQLDYVTVMCSRCLGPMCWLCGEVPSEERLPGRHRCAAVREDGDSYDHCSRCYNGRFVFGGSIGPFLGGKVVSDQRVFLSGTWNAWTLLEMATDPGDAYEAEVVLGDTLLEQFHVVVQQGKDKQIFHPVVKWAGPRAAVIGPVDKGQGKHWLIDGRRDGAREGTVYNVRFNWGDYQMLVTWRPVLQPGISSPLVVSRRYQHQYHVVNSLSSWVPVVGTHDPQDPYLWFWFNSRMPHSGRVEMLFLRDADQSQMIYPMASNPSDESVPVVGPDDGGAGKRWVAWGKEGEQLTCSLRVCEGDMRLTVHTASMGKRTYYGTTGNVYNVTGSWSKWAVERMRRDVDNADVWRASFLMGPQGREEFQILVNSNWNLRFYPSVNCTVPGATIVCGPDRKGNHKNWEVMGEPGRQVEVVLDISAEERQNMVACIVYPGESLSLTQ